MPAAVAGTSAPAPVAGISVRASAIPHHRPSSARTSARLRAVPSSRRTRTWTRPSGNGSASRCAARTASADLPAPPGPDTTTTRSSPPPSTSSRPRSSSRRPVNAPVPAGSATGAGVRRETAGRRASRPRPSIERYSAAMAGLGSRPNSRAISCR